MEVWEVFCDWVLDHKHLRRIVVSGLSLTRLQTKSLKSALKNSKAPIVEVDLKGCAFDTDTTLANLEEFIQDHYSGVQQANFWAHQREKYKNIKAEALVVRPAIQKSYKS